MTVSSRTGVVIVDAVVLSIAAVQTIGFGLEPSTANAINSLAILALALLTAWTASRTRKRDKIAKDTLEIAKATHTLSNSAMGAQLLNKVELLTALSVFAHRFAENGNAADLEAAKALDVRVTAAKTEYQAHQIAQAKVDAAATNTATASA